MWSLGLLRETLWMSSFNNEEEIDSFFRANMLLFNNLPRPYWANSKKGILNDAYYRIKLDITIDSKESVINQLIQNWKDRKVANIEYSFRAMEVILGIKARSLNASDLGENIIQLILKELEPFISRAEEVMKQETDI